MPAPRPLGLRVLVIDAYDEREMYAEALRAYGFEVTTAATALEGLETARRVRHDVIVQGLAFADLSGLELAARLKAGRETTQTPIIAISGFTDDAHVEAARAAGCRAVLIKPCDPRVLAAELRRVLAPPATTPSRRNRKRA